MISRHYLLGRFLFNALIGSLMLTYTTFAIAQVGVPARIVIISGNNQTTGVVGDTLQIPLVVSITDIDGNPVAGAQVDWNATTGGGSLTVSSSLTNSAGLASNILTLGTIYVSNETTATLHRTTKSVNFWTIAYPGPASTIGASSGDKQVGVVGTPLSAPLTVICRDIYGNVARHTPIDWTVESGNGSVAVASNTTGQGVASNTVELGTSAGVNKINATIHGMNTSYVFSATGIAGAPSQITMSSGNDQAGGESNSLSRPLTVTTKDLYGNPTSSTQVDWTTTSGGGWFTPVSTVSNSLGLASNTMVLGPTPGAQSAVATVHGTSLSLAFSATAVDAVVTLQPNPQANPKAFQPYFLGLSYEKNKINVPFFSVDNLPLVALFKLLGPGVLRIVAEIQPDPITWTHNGPGLTYQQVSQVDLARLAAFVKATNWKLLYGIALADNVAACAPGQTTCAADEAAVVSQEFGSSLLGFEIGNEPDQYANAVYGNPAVPQLANYTFDEFISSTPLYANGELLPSWPAFASAIQAAVPNAPLTGPSTGIVWDRLFASSDQAARAPLLTRHYYRSSFLIPPDMPTLLTPDLRIPKQFPELARDAAAGNMTGGYRISECNSVSGFIPGVTNGFGAALWTIDFLFQNALYQSTGVNLHGGGKVADTFSPILDDQSNVVGIGPDYYGMLAYATISKGGSLMTTQVTPAPATFSAYAVQQTNGTTDVILSNKDPDNQLTVSIVRSGTTAQASSLLLTAPGLTAVTGFSLGGNPINLDGSWSANASSTWPIMSNSALVTVPAASAQIVHLR